MNQMIAFPVTITLIIFIAVLTAIVTTALPYVPQLWYVLKSRIKRVFTAKHDGKDIVDIIIIAQLTERVDDLENQVNNLAERLSNRDTNRKNNVRREIRTYLTELRTDKND